MGSPDYLNWPTNGPYFDRHVLGNDVSVVFCANPNWGGGITWRNLGPRGAESAPLINTPTWTARGLRFLKTSSERALVANDQAVQPGTADFSIIIHYNAVSWPNNQTNLADKRNVGAPFTGFLLGRQGIQHATRGLALEVNGAARNVYGWNTGLDAFVTNAWKCLAIVADRSGDATPILDGEIGTSVDISGSEAQDVVGTNPLKIAGHHTNNQTWHFDGYIAFFVFVLGRLDLDMAAQITADPFRLFRRKEIAYFFAPAAPAVGAYAELINAGLAGGSRLINRGLVA